VSLREVAYLVEELGDGIWLVAGPLGGFNDLEVTLLGHPREVLDSSIPRDVCFSCDPARLRGVVRVRATCLRRSAASISAGQAGCFSLMNTFYQHTNNF
jgi:hypothetical protein